MRRGGGGDPCGRPILSVGVSTSEAIDPTRSPARPRSNWRQPPDFVSVNFSELGWAGIMRAALHAGIAVEAGLDSPPTPNS